MTRRRVSGPPPRILTREECAALGQRVLDLVAGSEAQVEIASRALARTSFALGDAHVGSQSEGVDLALALVTPSGRASQARTTRIDEAGLRALVADARAAAEQHRSPEQPVFLGPQTYPEAPQIFFDETLAAMSAEPQAAVFRAAAEAAEAAGLIGAGSVVILVTARSVLNTRGLVAYERRTSGQFSFAARTPDGTGSGWTSVDHENWARLDAGARIARAVDLGRRSAKPVAVEPGRYTVILEPDAVASLINQIRLTWSAENADQGLTVFANEPAGTNKIGVRMIDPRFDMISSPWDPACPGSTISESWAAIPGPVTWFEKGVLKTLAYSPEYAKEKGREPVIASPTLRLEAAGAPTSLEEMIATTQRGIWVNRLSDVDVMNDRTLLLTGTTRDGTFLIEHGKVTKPIKNLRFTESPFFALNRVEAFGTPVRSVAWLVVPRLKVRDFDFTGLTDAV